MELKLDERRRSQSGKMTICFIGDLQFFFFVNLIEILLNTEIIKTKDNRIKSFVVVVIYAFDKELWWFELCLHASNVTKNINCRKMHDPFRRLKVKAR
jgi:hypothetical protein